MAEQKAVKANVKFRLRAAQASPAPPVGSILGAQGVNMMEFVNAFNEQTKDMQGAELAVKVTIYEDRSFDFTTKGEPMSGLIKKAAGVNKGAGNPLKDKVGSLSQAKLQEVAEAKMADLNANDIEAAKKIVAGQARSMGITVED